METVEVVVRIPEEVYDALNKNTWDSCFVNDELTILEQAFCTSTQLPKGHGRLIDSNVLWDAFQDLGQDFYEAFDFAEANAVIEADKD